MAAKVEVKAVTEDQAAHLAALENAALDGAAVPGVQDEGPVQADPVQESRELWGMVFAVMAGVMPEVDRLYPAERVERIAVAWVPLAQKRGWDLGAILGAWGPEIMFAVAVVPPEVGRAILALVKAKLGKARPVPVQESEAAGEAGAVGV